MMQDIKSYIGQDAQFIMAYDFLIWYFGTSNIMSALILADIFNVYSMEFDKRKEASMEQIMFTSPYVQRRIPLSAKAVTNIM